MKILVVDDEPLNRFLLMHMLAENGYTNCVEAESGEDAIKKAELTPPDLVLLDVLMPGMSGFDVTPVLKQQQKDLYLPIIFITSLDDDESLAKGLDVGGDDFVSKPFNKVVLAAKLKAHSRTRFLSKQAKKQNQELLYHQRHIEREHAIVQHIFDNVLNMNPALTRFIDHHLAPASNFNGDMLLIERSPNAGLYILLGDFTGHGLASAIGAIPVSRAFQTMADKGIPVGEIASTLNTILLDFLPAGMFFACAIIEVAENGKTIDIWNGGLPHLILVDAESKIKHRFESQHMALGILDKEEFENDTVRFDLEYGDRLCGYTDGVIELTDNDNKMLGEEGLEAWIEKSQNITAKQVMAFIDDYRSSSEQADDITLFIFESKELGLNRKIRSLPQSSFRVDIHLQGDELKASNPVSEVVDLLSGHESFHGVRSNIFTVLSEIYNNALDHGVLGLDSKQKDSPDGFLEYFEEREKRLASLTEGEVALKVLYHAKPPCLIFNVKDSGKGFDTENITSKNDSDDAYGRGLSLIQELADRMEFEENGTSVTVWFLLDKGSTLATEIQQLPTMCS